MGSPEASRKTTSIYIRTTATLISEVAATVPQTLFQMGKMTRGFLRCILLLTFATLVLASSYGEDDDVTDDTGMNHVGQGWRIRRRVSLSMQRVETKKEAEPTKTKIVLDIRRGGRLGSFQKQRAHSFDE
ncbi:hypothetical protein MTO96_023774 [Rhipicephalus appendiculatus]